MSVFQEVIVVEGRDDTKRLREAFGDVDTIETQGSAISKETLALIAHAQEVRGVIVLTDPDFPGEKIRKTIMRAVPEAKHAFVQRARAVPKGQGSLGVEHTDKAALEVALQNLVTPKSDSTGIITGEDLLSAGLVGGAGSRAKREFLGDFLHIGYTNGKQLLRRLALFGITIEQFRNALQAMKEKNL